MRPSGTMYRQQVADFRKRLSALADRQQAKPERVMIDTTGNRSRVVPSRTEEERFTIYGRRRYFSIARVLALMELLRDLENLPLKESSVEVKAVGAYWQAFQGTSDMPACHTCPALLLLNGQLPTLMTNNLGLRRHIVVEFADCMLMPQLVNKLDRLLDDVSGWEAFERAAFDLLNDRSRKRTWRDALTAYSEGMRQMFPEMIAIIERDVKFADPEQNRIFDAMKAYYEGLFLTPINVPEMSNFLATVKAEIGR